jgi:hypothetical protein
MAHPVERWRAHPRHHYYFGEPYAKGHPFDHVELWDRDGIPLVLVGHPYGIRDDGRVTMAGLRALGMTVEINSETWYGFDTDHVEVYHEETLRAVEEGQARGPAAARPDSAAGVGPECTGLPPHA